MKVEKFSRSSGRLTVDEELEEYSKLVKGKRRGEEKQEQSELKERLKPKILRCENDAVFEPKVFSCIMRPLPPRIRIRSAAKSERPEVYFSMFPL